MSQSSIIAGTLLVAFFVYVTLKGHLPQYMQIVGIR